MAATCAKPHTMYAHPVTPLSAKVWCDTSVQGRSGKATSIPASNDDSQSSKSQQGWGELSTAEMASRVTQLQEMGFSVSAARSTLQICEWDVNRALDTLFKLNVPATAEGNILTGPKQPSSTRKPTDTKRYSLVSDSTSASSHDSSPCSSLLATPLQGPLLDPISGPLLSISGPLLSPDASRINDSGPLLSPDARCQRDAVTQPRFNSTFSAPPVSPVSVVPKRQLAKVEHNWTCEAQCSDTQISIEQDTFVYIWSDSTTSAGWVYAESLMCSSNAGWIPASMLQKLPASKCWMRISTPCHSLYPTQMAVDVGNIILVDVSQSPAGDGWIYAEAVASASGRVLTDISSEGWVPIQCITSA